MKKYLYTIVILSLIGAVLSGALFYQHYFPDTDMGILSCGRGLVNPCISVGQSSYSKVLGIPVAAFGLLFYLFILFTLLIVDYAREWYMTAAAVIMLPLSILGVCLDVVLGIIMIRIGDLCTLCVYTYLVNLVILLVSILWYNKIKVKQETSFFPAILKTLKTGPGTADRRAALSSYTLFIFLLAFSLFATNYIIAAKTTNRKSSHEQIQSFLTKFYETETEELNLPPSKLVLGNPDAEITIIAFTDFLCSACYSFYKTEKYLLAQFRDRVKIIYYHYPLDSLCNRDVSKSVYVNSCIAARAINAASDNNILTDYILAHFSRYREFNHEYTDEWANVIMNDLIKDNKTGKIDLKTFQKSMDSKENRQMLESHINAAVRLKIDATPTLFIGGRRLVGVPPKDLMEALILSELNKQK